ncbi:FAD/NAD(P) binding domain-containing protein [Primorskyibacter flagellatus]|uniref:FAD/NAD(P) binding domain-containing protein n=1 Tax=Primorskyibacter flagellatus TaxID=1387277 RepID=A0A917ABF2_9RHOB|nr:FAD/NAD(P)-binding protein [Primorskyibacter flagellatus]GGE38876.1 FAD/NAD(P) binding domain-containing protein [Primorskyibacter flagellatus]
MKQAKLRPARGKGGIAHAAVPSARPRGFTPPRVAIVGTGPTAIYALKHLLESGAPMDIHLFEREREIGTGMPYREGANLPQMLSNIGSREVPPVVETLEGFLRSCDAATRREFGIEDYEIGPETFYPRLVLGRYFMAQIAAMIARARGGGHGVEVHARHVVTDIVPAPDGVVVQFETPHAADAATFDHVIIATGHHWSARTDGSGVLLHAPWPAERLRRFAGAHVGIIGSSLTAIDTAIALASFHGRFEEAEGVRWLPNSTDSPFRMAMLSRRGLLPDADWFYPLPLPELPRFNPPAVEGLGQPGLLSPAQNLLARDLHQLDPAYAALTRPEKIEGYADRHFADRLTKGSWTAAKAGLEEAVADRDARRTAAWRMALLAAHLVYETILPQFTEQERELFDRELRPVFSDVYASVPHRSIRRMLALHDAGVLELHRLGETYTILPDGLGARISGRSGEHRFDHLIDARGQSAATLDDLGFPTLSQRGRFDPETLRVACDLCPASTIACVAIPVVLRHNPFVQGLENVEALGRRAADNVLASLGAPKAA